MKKFFIASCIALTISAASAATISVTRGFGGGVIAEEADGTTLTAGGYYFAAGSYDIVPTVGDYSSLVAAVDALNLFDSTTTLTSGTTQGMLTGSFNGTDPAFNNDQIYFVVGNGVDRAASTEFAIFTTGDFFPADVTGGGSDTVIINNFGDITTLANAGTAVDGGASVDTLQLVGQAVPEPSAALLGLVGLAIPVLRRRRD